MYNLNSWFYPADLNRIEGRVQEVYLTIASLVDVHLPFPSNTQYPGNNVYPSEPFKVKEDWDEFDLPFVEEIDRIKRNIIFLTTLLIAPSDFPDLQVGKRLFDFNEANKLDVALDAIISGIDKTTFRYANESYSGDTIWL